MAAIAEISSVHEWEDEWLTMEGELQQFKVIFYIRYIRPAADLRRSKLVIFLLIFYTYSDAALVTDPIRL